MQTQLKFPLKLLQASSWPHADADVPIPIRWQLKGHGWHPVTALACCVPDKGLHALACIPAVSGCKGPTQKQELQTVAVSARLGFTSAGGRLSRRFRPQGQAAGLGQASTVGQPPGRHQRQDMADVSIAGSEAGPSGRQAMPDEDPSLYTHRSNR